MVPINGVFTTFSSLEGSEIKGWHFFLLCFSVFFVIFDELKAGVVESCMMTFVFIFLLELVACKIKWTFVFNFFFLATFLMNLN